VNRIPQPDPRHSSPAPSRRRSVFNFSPTIIVTTESVVIVLVLLRAFHLI
jgi:hypothetical protein